MLVKPIYLPPAPRFSGSMAAASLAIACGGPTAPEESSRAIVGGWLEEGYPAVGYVLAGQSASAPTEAGSEADHELHYEPWCAMTLIAPDMAVTAAHCTKNRNRFAVGFGAMGSGDIIQVERVFVHPEYSGTGHQHDIAVFILAKAASIVPATVGEPAFTDSHLALGYGRTTIGPKGSDVGGWSWQRKSAPQDLLHFDSNTLWVSSFEGATCFGDSGGLLLSTDGTILGVLHGSPPDEGQACELGTLRIYTSLDGERAFLGRAWHCRDSSDASCMTEP